MSLPFLNTAPARAGATRWGAVTARHRVCADPMRLNAIAVRSLPEERAAEIAARTLALPDAHSVGDLTALLTSAGER